jgi:hypothetical protein
VPCPALSFFALCHRRSQVDPATLQHRHQPYLGTTLHQQQQSFMLFLFLCLFAGFGRQPQLQASSEAYPKGGAWQAYAYAGGPRKHRPRAVSSKTLALTRCQTLQHYWRQRCCCTTVGDASIGVSCLPGTTCPMDSEALQSAASSRLHIMSRLC